MAFYISLEQIESLDHIHARLGGSVLDTYGWPHNLSDEGFLEQLLALNLESANQGEKEWTSPNKFYS